MAADLLSPSAKTSPLKKRIAELCNIQTDNNDITDNIAESKDTSTISYHVSHKIEIPESPNPKTSLQTGDNIKQDHSVDNGVTLESIKTERSMSLEAENIKDKVQSDNSNTSLTTLQKPEEQHNSTTDTCNVTNGLNTEDCKVECDGTTHNDSTSVSALKKELSESPTKNSNESMHNASVTTPVSSRKGKHGLDNHDTVRHKSTPQKKRKISNVSDYDQLSDTVKSELYETAKFNDFEAIELLHDLDTVMDYEDIKVTPDILLPSMGSNNNTQDSDELTSELYNDPPMDPLFIASDDELENVDYTETGGTRVKSNKRTAVKQSRTKNCKRKKPVSVTVNKRSRPVLPKGTRNTKVDYDNDHDITEDSEDSSEESSKFSKRLELKLKDLKIQLTHTVPPQHQIENSAGSKPPTQEQKNLFMKYGPLRRGTYSPMEDEIIKNNWKTFCRMHRWRAKEVKPFLCMRHENKFYIHSLQERQKFVQFLANGLPWRTLYSVYLRFKKLYDIRENNYNRYTVGEDKIILRYMENVKLHGNKLGKCYSKLARILGRTNHSIWLRYQTLKKMQENKKKPLSAIKWTVSLINKFIKNLLQTTLSEDIEELKNATIPKPVWLKLEEKININHNVLKSFWMQQLHMQLFCPHSIYLNDIKIQLIEYIYGKGISNTREIIWPNVAKYFEGITSIFLCKVFFYLVQEVTSKVGLRKFPDIVEYLYDTKISEIRDEVTDKYLPRLTYVNGSVQIVDEDTSNYTDDK